MSTHVKQSTPSCAKIWNFIYSLKGVYKRYARDIEDICCKDSLADQNGLTVIIPDEGFMNHFHDNIHGDGSASTAKRILMNTIIRKHMPTVNDFKELGVSIPFRSGLTMPLNGINSEKETVTLSDNIVIKRRQDFKPPRGFNYAVWEVTSGIWPIGTSYEVKRKKPKLNKDVIQGGANLLINVGEAFRGSAESQRIHLIENILKEYGAYLKSNTKKTINPLLLKCVSLYNWLSMYYKDVLHKILIVTDINPGINLLLQILDPNSMVNNIVLFGTHKASDPAHIRNGWRNATITNNPSVEWMKYLEMASNWSKTSDKLHEYNKDLNRVRHNLLKGTKRDPAAIGKNIKVIYNGLFSENPVVDITKYVRDDVYQIMKARYENMDGRKMWEDQLRYVGTSTFDELENSKSNGNHLSLVSLPNELIESLQSTVSFRPLSGTGSYEKAATFTYEGGRFMSNEGYFLTAKWVSSTNFMFMPASLNSDSLAKMGNNVPPYGGVIDSPVIEGSFINCHRINYEALLNSGRSFEPQHEIMHNINLTLLQNSDGAQLSEMLAKLNMDNYQPHSDDGHIGGDKLLHGGRLEPKKGKKRRNIRRCPPSDSSGDDDNDLGMLANLTFLVQPQHEEYSFGDK